MRLASQIETRECGFCGNEVRVSEHEDTVCDCGYVVKRVESETAIRGYE